MRSKSTPVSTLTKPIKWNIRLPDDALLTRQASLFPSSINLIEEGNKLACRVSKASSGNRMFHFDWFSSKLTRELILISSGCTKSRACRRSARILGSTLSYCAAMRYVRSNETQWRNSVRRRGRLTHHRMLGSDCPCGCQPARRFRLRLCRGDWRVQRQLSSELSPTSQDLGSHCSSRSERRPCNGAVRFLTVDGKTILSEPVSGKKADPGNDSRRLHIPVQQAFMSPA